MNKDGSLKQPNRQSTYEYKYVHKLLSEWALRNVITERCVVHHRDDIEETRKYNNEHYELWGFNLDGTFEYGEYIVFMTVREHISHHHKGKVLSEETKRLIGISSKQRMTDDMCKKISSVHKGKSISDAQKVTVSAKLKGRVFGENHRAKLLESTRGYRILYTAYKNNGGVLKWNNFKIAVANGEITFELQPISVFISKGLTNDND